MDHRPGDTGTPTAAPFVIAALVAALAIIAGLLLAAAYLLAALLG